MVETKVKELGEGRVRILSMSFAQVRILKALNKSTNGLTRPQIGEKAFVNSSLSDSLGPLNAEDLATSGKKNGRPSLLGLKFVSCTMQSVEDKPIYAITASGRKALDVLATDPAWPVGH